MSNETIGTVTLTYDIDSNDDNNVYNIIKDYLVSKKGYLYELNYSVKENNILKKGEITEMMPNTTLMKTKTTLRQAIVDFESAFKYYEEDKKIKVTGKVLATMENKYRALIIK